MMDLFTKMQKWTDKPTTPICSLLHQDPGPHAASPGPGPHAANNGLQPPPGHCAHQPPAGHCALTPPGHCAQFLIGKKCTVNNFQHPPLPGKNLEALLQIPSIHFLFTITVKSQHLGPGSLVIKISVCGQRPGIPGQTALYHS